MIHRELWEQIERKSTLRVAKVTCDRCQRELTRLAGAPREWNGGFIDGLVWRDGLARRYEFHLCDLCLDEFRTWLGPAGEEEADSRHKREQEDLLGRYEAR